MSVTVQFDCGCSVTRSMDKKRTVLYANVCFRHETRPEIQKLYKKIAEAVESIQKKRKGKEIKSWPPPAYPKVGEG